MQGFSISALRRGVFITLIGLAFAVPPAVAQLLLPTNNDPSHQIRFSSPSGADAARLRLTQYIWSDGLPVSRLPAVTPNIGSDVFSGALAGIDQSLASQVSRLDSDVSGFDFHSISYLLRPVNTAHSNQIVIIHQGHAEGYALDYGLVRTTNALLQQGFSVDLMQMPLFGWNFDNTANVPGQGTLDYGFDYDGHVAIINWTGPAHGGMGFRLFLEPVIQNINYFKTLPGQSDIAMTGVSGGGWTTHMAAAIDPRIRWSIPVAGSAPLYSHNSVRFNDGAEETYTPLFNENIAGDGSGGGIATWLEIYALGGYGAGRKQIMVTNEFDPCCFSGFYADTFKSIVSHTVNDLLGQGRWDYYRDSTTPYHEISANTLFAVIFPVLGLAPPMLSSINAVAGAQGSIVSVTLKGINFVAPLTIDAGAGITVSNIGVADSTTATATLEIGESAALGARNIIVRTVEGASGPVIFTVLPPRPTLASVAPAIGVQGALAQVTLTGTNFVSPAVFVSGPGVTVTNITASATGSATATFAIAANAALGAHNVTVTTGGGTTSAATFTVFPPAPMLTDITPTIGVRDLGTILDVTLIGTNFVNGLTIGPIAGITVSDINVTSPTTATATFSIADAAAPGVRDIAVATVGGASGTVTFSIVDPFPDLSVASFHTSNFGVGFDETYTVVVTNSGTKPTAGTITVSNALQAGLTFVSGTGDGWSCFADGQTVTCTNSTVLARNASSSYTLAVRADAAGSFKNVARVAAPGDLNAVNDSSSDPTTVLTTPAPVFVLAPSPLLPGQPATVVVTITAPFPHDVTGSVTLDFVPNAVVPVDDPAIQFATGGRTIAFTIPANNVQARFGSAANIGPIGFQTGTVAGTLSFAGRFTVGAINGTFFPSVAAAALTIPRLAPSVQNIETSTQGGFAAMILLSSTTREVTHLILTFNTNPSVRLSCGTAAHCAVSGNALTFDVTELFTAWFNSDTTFGSLSVLRLPFSISGGTVRGAVVVTLQNSQGISNAMSFALP